MDKASAWAELVKASVSAREAGERLGLDVNRDGRCACPFHNGRDKNMKLYGGEKGYYCFVCHERGDVIGLARAVTNSTFTEAVQWLSDEFHLGIDVHAKTARETAERAKKRRKTREALNRLARKADEQEYKALLDAAELDRTVERMIEENRPKTPEDEWNRAFCTALKLRTEARELAEQAQVMGMGGTQKTVVMTKKKGENQ